LKNFFSAAVIGGDTVEAGQKFILSSVQTARNVKKQLMQSGTLRTCILPNK